MQSKRHKPGETGENRNQNIGMTINQIPIAPQNTTITTTTMLTSALSDANQASFSRSKATLKSFRHALGLGDGNLIKAFFSDTVIQLWYGLGIPTQSTENLSMQSNQPSNSNLPPYANTPATQFAVSKINQASQSQPSDAEFTGQPRPSSFYST